MAPSFFVAQVTAPGDVLSMAHVKGMQFAPGEYHLDLANRTLRVPRELPPGTVTLLEVVNRTGERVLVAVDAPGSRLVVGEPPAAFILLPRSDMLRFVGRPLATGGRCGFTQHVQGDGPVSGTGLPEVVLQGMTPVALSLEPYDGSACPRATLSFQPHGTWSRGSARVVAADALRQGQ